MTPRMRVAVRAWPWILALLVLLPVLAPGYVLSYDMVFVPDLAMRSDFLGFGTSLPRAVPSDAVVALLDEVIPGMLLQKLVLVAALVLAGLGARRLVSPDNGVAQLAATSVYVWNPYVAERLGLGHWPVLLAYASLPWIFDAARRVRRGEPGLPALVLWLALAALSAAGGLMAAVMAVACLAGRGRAALRRTAVVLVAALSLNAPWLVVGVLRAEHALSDPAAVGLFAARGEGALPMPLAALGLGGVWNVEVVPLSRLGWAGVAALVLTGLVCAVGWRAWRSRLPGRDRTALAVCAAVGLLVAASGALLPEVMERLVATVPGAGLFRDGARFLALVAPVEASLFGMGAGVLAGVMRERLGNVMLAAGAVLMPLALMPDLGWGLAGALRPVDFPQEYAQVREALEQRSPTEPGGSLLVLPFSSYRAPSWNHGRRTLDPTGRYMPTNYVASDVLYVSGRRVPGEDARARRVERLLAEGLSAEEVARSLSALGVRWVVLDQEARAAVREPGISPSLGDARVTFAGEHLRLWELPAAVAPVPVGAWRTGLIAGSWVLAAGVVGVAAAGLVRSRRPAWRIRRSG